MQRTYGGRAALHGHHALADQRVATTAPAAARKRAGNARATGITPARGTASVPLLAVATEGDRAAKDCPVGRACARHTCPPRRSNGVSLRPQGVSSAVER